MFEVLALTPVNIKANATLWLCIFWSLIYELLGIKNMQWCNKQQFHTLPTNYVITLINHCSPNLQWSCLNRCVLVCDVAWFSRWGTAVASCDSHSAHTVCVAALICWYGCQNEKPEVQRWVCSVDKTSVDQVSSLGRHPVLSGSAKRGSSHF